MNDKTEIKKNLKRDAAINAAMLMMFWLFYYLISYISPELSELIVKDTGSSAYENLNIFIFYVLLYPVGFSLIFLMYRKITKNTEKPKITSYLKKPATSPGWTAKWIFLTIGASYAASYSSAILFLLLEALLGIRLSAATMQTDPSLFGIITTLIATTVFAPVFEELFFRCTLFGNVRSYGTSSMIIACGFTFGIWHANYPQFLMAAVMGICSCFLLEKTGSVFPSMIVHFIFNSIGATMSVLLSSTGILQGDPMTQSEEMTAQLMENPLICIAILLMCLMVIVILVVWLVFMIIEITDHRESFCLEKKNTELSEKKKFALYMTQPFMLIVMLFMLGLTIYRALGGEM